VASGKGKGDFVASFVESKIDKDQDKDQDKDRDNDRNQMGLGRGWRMVYGPAMGCWRLPLPRGFCLLLAVMLPVSGLGQSYSNTSSVVDGAGNISGGGSYSNVNAIAQPSGVSVSSGGTFYNYAGFLGTFSLQTGLNTDGDALDNEADPDNDNDGLVDPVELDGTAFTPNSTTFVNVPDSDFDGLDDGEEATAGTDPNDPGAVLAFTSISTNSPEITVAWRARGGKTYDLFKKDDLLSDDEDLLLTTNVTGGVGGWMVVTSRYTDATSVSTNERSYLIKVKP